MNLLNHFHLPKTHRQDVIPHKMVQIDSRDNEGMSIYL